ATAASADCRVVAPPPVLTPIVLRDLILPNRVALSLRPTDAADNGMPHEGYSAQLYELAQGDAALVMTEPIAVSADGRITSGCVGMYRPEHAAVWAHLVERVHADSS